ncbi:MAG: cytochrome c biogenesis protein CcsA, partial [bacterium]
YFLLELLTDIRGTGSFIIFFSLVFQIISSLYIKDLLEVREVLRNNLLGLHVTSALLGYSGLTISAVYGILFILLYKDLKLNKFSIIFKRLPSLETLEKLSFYSAMIGFVMLTITIILGGIWLPMAFEEFSYFDPKVISTGIIWLIYGIGLFTKLLGNWYGKKVIIFSLIGFSLMLLSLLLSNLLADSFHSFS